MANIDWLSRKLILIMGKGGVGKTTLSTAAAQVLASKGRRVLLVHALQFAATPQKMEQVLPNLWEITLNPSDCFREYIILKLKVRALYTLLLGNRVMQYLEKAAPGVRELVLMGKIWFEDKNFDHVVVDMPSTGYALTMLHAPVNFAALFPGGPVYRDALDMLDTLKDPEHTAYVIVSLAEEMPIQESIELSQHLQNIAAQNAPWLLINRVTKTDYQFDQLYERLLSSPQRAVLEKSPHFEALSLLIQRKQSQAKILKHFESQIHSKFRKGFLEISESPGLENSSPYVIQEQLKDAHHAQFHC